MQKAPKSRKGGQDGDGVAVVTMCFLVLEQLQAYLYPSTAICCVSLVLFVQDHVPEFGFICVEDNGNVLVLISCVTAVTMPMYWYCYFV
jgi:hypothetical protein